MNSGAKLPAASWLLCAASLAVLSGCAPAPSNPSAKPVVSPVPRSISLALADAAACDETIEKSRGNVVLVDFWATWCAPCVEQFPHTVKLHRKYRDRGLTVISLSMNAPGEERQVRDFLERHDADFENLLSSYDSPVAATKEFRLPGPVPCYRVYDRAGELRHEFSLDPRAERQFTLADIEAAVEELL
jgi:thiol-disulfide isomerase/thioredoxin